MEEIQKMQIQNGVQNPVNWMDQLKISNILRNSLPSVMTITALLLAHQQFQIFDGGKAENSQASRTERHVRNEFSLILLHQFTSAWNDPKHKKCIQL